MGDKCYRVNCNCLSPGFYSEFDTRAEAQEHIKVEHPDTYVVYLVVPVDRFECQHPRHKENV